MSSQQSILERAVHAHDRLGPAMMRVVTRTRQGIWVTSTLQRQYRLNDWEHFQAIEQRCKPRLRWYVNGAEGIIYHPERQEWCRSPQACLSACNDGGVFSALEEIKRQGSLGPDLWDAMVHADMEPTVLGKAQATRLSWKGQLRVPEITSRSENGQTDRIPPMTISTKGSLIVEEDSGRIRAYEFSAAGPVCWSTRSSLEYQVFEVAFPPSVCAFDPPPDATEVDAEDGWELPRTWDRKGTFRFEGVMQLPR